MHLLTSVFEEPDSAQYLYASNYLHHRFYLKMPGMKITSAAALVALVALLCAQGAHAHGYLAIPKSRNFLNPAD